MIAIGQIARSNGLRGEVRVNLLTESPDRLRQLTSVWIGQDDATAQPYRIERVRLHRSQAVVKFGTVDSREAAEGLKHQFIFIEEQNAAVLPKGSYFIHDIVGMEVSTEEGVRVGCVEEVWQLPANDVWVVRENGKEILLPAIRDVIRSVDVRRKHIVIHPMDGLLE
jgi:16S rRNA processing protein RimM